MAPTRHEVDAKSIGASHLFFLSIGTLQYWYSMMT